MKNIQKCHYHFLGGNHTEENCRHMMADLVQSYKAMECKMSLTVHFLDSHLRLLPRKSQDSER